MSITRELAQFETATRLRKPSRHQSLFRYIGLTSKTSWEYLERTLNRFELVGATATSLNDPFELSPAVFDDLRPTTIAAALGQSGTAALADEPDLRFQDTPRFRSQANEFLERMKRYARVIAFCERSDSPLLWSHYANSYAGACLHFLGGGLAGSRCKVGYVTYTSHRPIYPLSLALSLAKEEWRPVSPDQSMKQAESDKLLFFSKASDWSYETEVRAIYNSNSDSSISFDQEGLVSIILGPRMAPRDRDRLRGLVASSKMPHLAIRPAELSMNSFSVEVNWDAFAAT